MNKQIQEVTTDVTETGESKLVQNDWTPDDKGSPRNADVLRLMAYNQARALADAIDKTLCKTIEQLYNETDDLTHDEEEWLCKAFYLMHTARRALNKTFGTLLEWRLTVECTPERMEQLSKALQELDERQHNAITQ